MAGDSDQSVYASAQLGPFLSNELEGKENTMIYEYAGMIDDTDTLDLLNYYCGIYEDTGDDFLDTRLAEIIIKSAATRMTDRAVREGNVSQMQRPVGLRNHNRDADDALTEILDRLTQEGCVATVVGPPGSGKTSLTVDVARGWGVRTGGHLYGNTSWDGFDQVVRSDLELLEAMASVEGPTLGVLDEIVRTLSGRGETSKSAEKFANRTTLLRKREGDHGPHAKRGSLLTVAHNFDRLNAPMRRMTTLYIQKPSRKDPGKVVLWESEGGRDTRERIDSFEGWTDSRESFAEYEASAFEIITDDSDDDGPEIDVDEIQKDKDKETAIRAILNGQSQKDAAKLTDYKRGWVGERWREWCDGDHRDLVPLPDTLPDGVTWDEIETE